MLTFEEIALHIEQRIDLPEPTLALVARLRIEHVLVVAAGRPIDHHKFQRVCVRISERLFRKDWLFLNIYLNFVPTVSELRCVPCKSGDPNGAAGSKLSISCILFTLTLAL